MHRSHTYFKQPNKKTFIVTIFTLFCLVYFLPSVIVLLADREETIQPALIVNQPQEIEEKAIQVTVKRNSGTEILTLEDYVFGVVAGEMPASFHLEALKAQAIAARTYIIHKGKSNASTEQIYTVSDTTFDQVYKSTDELKALWQEQYDAYQEKIHQAVNDTKGQVLVYEEAIIFPAFFSTSNGYTENAEDYWAEALPYLRSVESPWDQSSPKFNQTITLSKREVIDTLQITEDALLMVRPVYNDSGRLKWVAFGQTLFTGRELREALQLPSTDISITVQDNHVTFETEGFGHGVGMSQYGANGMAKAGYTHVDILNHYYQGAEMMSLSKMGLDS